MHAPSWPWGPKPHTPRPHCYQAQSTTWGRCAPFPPVPPHHPGNCGPLGGRGPLPLHPCRPAAGHTPAPRSPETRAAEQKCGLCGQLPILPPSRPSLQTHVHGAPSAPHADAPVTTGHRLRGLGLSDGSPPRRQHARGAAGSTREAWGVAVPVQAAPPRVAEPARSCLGAPGPVPAHAAVTKELMLLPQASAAPHTGAWSRQLCTPPPPGHREPSTGEGLWPGHTRQDRVAAQGSIFLRNRCRRGSWKRPHFSRTRASG